MAIIGRWSLLGGGLTVLLKWTSFLVYPPFQMVFGNDLQVERTLPTVPLPPEEVKVTLATSRTGETSPITIQGKPLNLING